MKNRNKIVSALILFLEEDIREQCKARNFPKSRIENVIEISKDKIEQGAELILMEYENHLFKKISNEIIADLKEIVDHNELLLKDLVNGVITKINDNYSGLSKSIFDLVGLQRRIRIQILEEEIENSQLDMGMLKKHQEALDKITKKEANKVSWYFVLIVFATLIVWFAFIQIFHWEIMEKWTFISGIILVLLEVVFFAIFGKKFSYETLRNKKIEILKSHNYNLHKFDSSLIERIEKLVEKKKEELEETARNSS